MPGIVSWFRSTGRSPTSPVLRSAPDVNLSTNLAAMDHYLPWSASLSVGESADFPLLPAPLTPRRMVEGKVVPGSVVASPPGETDVVGGPPEKARIVSGGPL